MQRSAGQIDLAANSDAEAVRAPPCQPLKGWKALHTPTLRKCAQKQSVLLAHGSTELPCTSEAAQLAGRGKPHVSKHLLSWSSACWVLKGRVHETVLHVFASGCAFKSPGCPQYTVTIGVGRKLSCGHCHSAACAFACSSSVLLVL